MAKKLFVANWKSNKTEEEAAAFLNEFSQKIENVDLTSKQVIIAPPFTLLSVVSRYIQEHNLPVEVSAQNVSPFPKGAYTGEINASQVKEFATHVIIGHSERRKYFHEQNSDMENKVREAKSEGLIVIQCIQDENDLVQSGVEIVAYEPPSAIGSGNPDSPDHIAEVFQRVLEKNPGVTLLYGGSVAPENFQRLLEIEQLGGFLVGGASLNPDSFISLLS